MNLPSALGTLACLWSWVVPGLAASQEPPPPITTDAITVRLRARYDAGFARIIALVSDSSPDSPQWPLWALGRFKRLNVRWAALQGRAYRALERGNAAAGWLAIIPPGHDFLRTERAVFSLDPSPTLHVITIRPEEVTDQWAGVFLVPAVSHLADRVLGATPRDATPGEVLLSDFRAYELELTAADLLAEGAVRATLDSLLNQARPSSTAQLASQASAIALTNRALLNWVLPAGEPKSHAEATLRAGFLAMALLVRYAERYGLPADSILTAIDHVQRSAPPP